MNNKNVHLTNEKKLKTKKVKDSNNSSSGWSKFLTMLQELGKVLQFPIAVLPFAAILNRFGALGITYSSEVVGDKLIITNQIGYWISLIIQKPGSIPFDNLALLFAIGCAFGLAKDHRGEVALVAVIFYLSIAALTGEKTLPEMLYGKLMTFTTQDGKDSFSKLLYVQKMDGDNIVGGVYVLSTGVLGGIVSGCLSAFLYNRFKDIKLPTALSFFGGRRFVPMIALVVTIPTALAFAIIWPWIQLGLISFGTAVANPENPAVAIPGTTAYSILNRLLLPFGLHQIMNTFFWFQMPVSGNIVQPGFGSNPSIGTEWVTEMGDINAFAKGISNSGLFQAGFFPIMMGGLPMAAVAMIMTADKNNRKEIAGFLGGVAGVSFLSGITEPLEFSFVFIAPVLLGVHAGLTGIFMAITTAMKIQIGFGFSAGFIDYAASLPQSWALSNYQGNIISNPLWILVLTAAAGATYYFVFYFVIKWMNLSTPGRNVEAISPNSVNTSSKASTTKETSQKGDKYENMASIIVEAIGKDNFVSIDNCATRLRLILKDNSKIDDALIKSAGTYGIKRLGTESLQIVIGPDVEHAANALKKIVVIQENKEVKEVKK
ncbi:PTS transporter subunit EIIC [Spiroplasma cantharicola]|uniref:PTS system, N-acetylglucosamine-specific IIC component n=1 Tax=Spiroplasma cantharicola TaxID=362837 RepID=A0A0M4JW53_9MOLU|nr:PTS transporter subunit EIIC [Spiroplasma cantharicola]ALD66117.1 PTS system, N-acetylglucosamine-specific IIC component [Spiroplasma cantharicola]